jgi:rRNA maturation RNase YbeY
MPASFYQQDTDARLKDKRKLSAFLDGLVHKHLKNIKKVGLSYIFCSDEYLLQINQAFLDHDTLTDIITFDLSERSGELAGEIYISIERVKENAVKFGVSYNNELHRVIFHGALHLCGFGDKKAADKKEMRQMEDQCLAQYFEQ